MAFWMFILLLIGISKTAISFGNTDCFDECYDSIFKQLPEVLISNDGNFTNEMKEEFFDCTEKEMKRCGWWEFSSLKQTQNSCDSISGCTEEEMEQEKQVNNNKYSFLNCLDEHRRDLVECMGNNILESIQAELKVTKPEANENLYLCSTVQKLLPCFRRVSIQKCGKDAKELFLKEFGRYIPKDVMDSCSF